MPAESHPLPSLDTEKRSALLQAYHDFIKNNPKSVKPRHYEEPDFYVNHDTLELITVGDDGKAHVLGKFSSFEETRLAKRMLVRERDKEEHINREHMAVPLEEAITLIRAKLAETNDGRIRTPFEVVIKKGTITEKDLEALGWLPFEIMMRHDDSHTLILGTGSPDRGAYDYEVPTHYDSHKEGREKEDDIIRAGIAESQRAIVTSLRESQPFTLHNHPSGTDTPSYNDLELSLNSKSECDFIIAHDKIVLFKNLGGMYTSELAYKLMADDQKHAELRATGVMIAVVPFSDPRIDLVLDFLNGNSELEDIKMKIAGKK